MTGLANRNHQYDPSMGQQGVLHRCFSNKNVIVNERQNLTTIALCNDASVQRRSRQVFSFFNPRILPVATTLLRGLKRMPGFYFYQQQAGELKSINFGAMHSIRPR
jgi:hypothetical protein